MRRGGFAIVVVAAGGCVGVLEETGQDVQDDPLGDIPEPACDDPQVSPGDGHHHPGEDCLMCHHQGGMAPPYTFAGTLFTASGGAMPRAGATLHLIDALGTDVIVVTADNGNFWSIDLVTYPVVAFASLCPDVTPMIAPLRETDGSCNASGCHTSGFRLHVP
jgi:hypothetical protein